MMNKDVRFYLEEIITYEDVDKLMALAHEQHEARRGGLVMHSFCVCGYHSMYTGNYLCRFIEKTAEFIKNSPEITHR